MHLNNSGAFLILSKTINIFNNSFWEKQTFSQTRLSLKLTFVIAESRACLLISRTRTRKRDARARARSTQVPRALAYNVIISLNLH